MKNLHYTLIDLFFAGSDTVSSTLGWALLYLSLWPEKQVKVQQEIDSKIGPRSVIPSMEHRPGSVSNLSVTNCIPKNS